VWSDDGTRIATAAGCVAQIWPTADASKQLRIAHPDGADTIALPGMERRWSLPTVTTSSLTASSGLRSGLACRSLPCREVAHSLFSCVLVARTAVLLTEPVVAGLRRPADDSFPGHARFVAVGSRLGIKRDQR
jgi:hypothetical protein